MLSGKASARKEKSRKERLFDIRWPGEYGEPHKPSGFIVVMHEKLGKQRIFISSVQFREIIAAHYKIPAAHIVSLIESLPGKKDGIPEAILEGRAGLQMFQQRLEKVKSCTTDILIHCKQGQNRSPVAAVIYLIMRGLTAHEAIEAVTTSYQIQRNNPKFELNSRGHYTAVLQEAYCLQENSSIQGNVRTKRHKVEYALRNRNV